MAECSTTSNRSPGIDTKRLDALLNAFPERKLLVVGDLMLDEYIWGQAKRISPEAPIPVVEVQRTTYSVGGAANVARNVHTMGATVLVAGVAGNDPSGATLLDSLRESGCPATRVVIAAGRPTTVKTRVVAQNQQVVRVDRETREQVGGAALEQLLSIVEEAVPAMDAVILSDYAKGVLTDRLITAAIQGARRHGKPLAANLKPPHVDAFRGATLLTLNLSEAERASQQSIPDEATLFRCGRVLRERLACDALLVTRGGDGVALFTSDNPPLSLSAQSVQVFDVTGAGDTVISAAGLALSAGATFAEAAAIGNLAGNIKVTKLGTAAVDRDEIRRFVLAQFSQVSSHGIVTPAGASRRAAA